MEANVHNKGIKQQRHGHTDTPFEMQEKQVRGGGDTALEKKRVRGKK